jgi:S-adenosyl methyltransferase
VAPECRVVSVDNDPQVLAHARALLTSSPQGATAYLDADLRDPDKILQQAARTLDLTRPTTCAAPIGSLASSTASSWWSPASSPLHDGVPSPARPASRQRSIRPVASGASPSAREAGSGPAQVLCRSGSAVVPGQISAQVSRAARDAYLACDAAPPVSEPAGVRSSGLFCSRQDRLEATPGGRGVR